MDRLLVLVPVSMQATCEYFSYLRVHRLLAGYLQVTHEFSYEDKVIAHMFDNEHKYN